MSFLRIGIDIRNVGRKRTGDEVVFLNMVRELARLDDSNEYDLFLDTRSQSEYHDISRRLGILGRDAFHLVPLPARNKFDWNTVWLPRYLHKHPVHVYHTQYIAPFFIPKKTALVTHVHDMSFRAYPQYIAPLDRFFLSRLMPRSIDRSRIVMSPSSFTKREIVKYYGIPEEKIVVVHNALSREFLEAPFGKTEAVREKYHLPEESILSVGTLQPRKNLPFLIEAFSRFRNGNSPAKLVIVGSRTGHHVDPDIDRTIDRLGLREHVIFPGFVDQEDLPILMESARVFAFPSRYEGFGIPILEAMSRGVPVVASDIPALRETAGDAALFAPPESVPLFAEALKKAYRAGSDRESCISKGTLRSQSFSWEESARSVLATYRKICFHRGTV